MPDPVKTPKRNVLFNADVMLALVIGAVLFIMLFPLPPLLLDLLLVLNISVAVLILLLMFYVQNPLEMSSFPSLLLVFTLYRLSLNVASTKLILLDGRAGAIIDAFGRFVVGNNYVVGAVVFLILVMIQFIVITRGAGRIAEVAARFTLDAMPGKQMSIDADLNAGIIDEHEARRRREQIADEAEFYGAMDGASKFIKGDAAAGLVITAINIVGGLCIGVFQQKMPAGDALQTYTILTIGDGLVSQIPALVISVGSGILVTKTASDDHLGTHFSKQLLRRPEPLFICAAMLFILGILPGLPFTPFVALAAAAAAIGTALHRRRRAGSEPDPRVLVPGSTRGKALAAAHSDEEDANRPVTPVTPMTLEIGFSLVPLVDTTQGGDLVERIGLIRKQVKEELGLMIPPISIQDNIALDNNEYRVLLRGLERARGRVEVGSHLAIDPGDVMGEIEGQRTHDPAFGFPAVWINTGRVDAAEARGYTVVDAASVVTTHVTKVVRDHAADLLCRQDVSDMLDEVKATDKAVVEELIPDQLTIGVVHRVLQNLLQEKVPIHDLPAILETLSDHAVQTKDPAVLTEFSRQALKGHIVAGCLTDDGTLFAVTLAPELEEEIQQAMSQGTMSGATNLPPERLGDIATRTHQLCEQCRDNTGADPVLLVSPLIRLHVYRLIARRDPDLAVLSYAEVVDNVPLEVFATVDARGRKMEAAV